jgi:aminopeptidase-like protein
MKDGMLEHGQSMYQWLKDLFPMCRSITGDGLRETLDYLQEIIPGLERHQVPSGTSVFDWKVPDEWNVREAYCEDINGARLIDFRQNNLHLVGYSEPINAIFSREQLLEHLHWLPDQPTAIPYVTSYYQRNWGFCVTQEQLDSLGDGPFRVVIDSDIKPGYLDYADLVLPGEEAAEVLLSTYVCHPSMANNELSGPVVLAALARWLQALPRRRLTYRIVFVPETIGAIAYISRHLDHLRSRVVAGFVLTCVGDERGWSLLHSRRGNTLADRVAQYVLTRRRVGYSRYSFLDRGSDERQYCSPLVDLPVASIMRSKYGTYEEYHTSLDDLALVSPVGLAGSLDVYRECLQILDANLRYVAEHPCEPQLGRRGLYPNLSIKGGANHVRSLSNLLAYADGSLDLLAIAEQIDISMLDCIDMAQSLVDAGLLRVVASEFSHS